MVTPLWLKTSRAPGRPEVYATAAAVFFWDTGWRGSWGTNTKYTGFSMIGNRWGTAYQA
jgi:hypothetical protein